MLTREKLKKLHQLTLEVRNRQEHASELKRIADDRYGERTHKLERNGKLVSLDEKTLWEEVFYIGTASEAAELLRKEHPQVFEAYAEQEKAADELKKYCKTELDIDFSAITLSDYLRLTEQMFDMLLGEHARVAADGTVARKSLWQRIFNK